MKTSKWITCSDGVQRRVDQLSPQQQEEIESDKAYNREELARERYAESQTIYGEMEII